MGLLSQRPRRAPFRGLRWHRRGRWSKGTGGAVLPPHNELVVALAAIPGLALVWAGALKLRRPFPASLAIVRFGLARRVRPAVGRAAGGIEVAAGTLLLARPQSPWAYVPAIALLGLFVGLLSRAVARGERFGCACFGSEADEGISLVTLGRTAALLALCATALGWTQAASLGAPYGAGYFDALAVSALLLASLHLAVTINSTQPFRE